MAKFTYTTLMSGWDQLRNIFDEETLFLDGHSAKTAVFTDEAGGEHIVLKGSNLAYNVGADKITGGKVETIEFRNDDGETLATMTGGDFSAKSLSKLLHSSNGFELFYDTIRSGNDTVAGSSGSEYLASGMGNDKLFGNSGGDFLDGGRGNDRLAGGNGTDYFSFGAYYDKDVVTDFDANGGKGKQDFIAADWDNVVSKKQVGDDVVLDFGSGDVLTLLDTDRADITKADFDVPV